MLAPNPRLLDRACDMVEPDIERGGNGPVERKGRGGSGPHEVAGAVASRRARYALKIALVPGFRGYTNFCGVKKGWGQILTQGNQILGNITVQHCGKKNKPKHKIKQIVA